MTGVTSEARTSYHCGVDIVQTLVFCVVVCEQVFVLKSIYPLAIVLSFRFRFTTSGYLFCKDEIEHLFREIGYVVTCDS